MAATRPLQNRVSERLPVGMSLPAIKFIPWR